MKKRLKHVGVDAFLSEREGLLNEFDRARRKTADDSVKTDHGILAESIFRGWLSSFLPKRYAVTKGYIITGNLLYQGPMEEWDIIIYDALESPVLFYKDKRKGRDARRGIPVEHVRAVLEVKATLNPTDCKRAARKLGGLRPFLGKNTSKKYPVFLNHPFISGTVFFETRVRG